MFHQKIGNASASTNTSFKARFDQPQAMIGLMAAVPISLGMWLGIFVAVRLFG